MLKKLRILRQSLKTKNINNLFVHDIRTIFLKTYLFESRFIAYW